jgi:membrane protease YdiL (CAAX protease family)
MISFIKGRWGKVLSYFLWTTIEELVFRVLLIHFAGHNWWGIVMSTLVYAFVHCVIFKWQMVAACLPLGLLLGYLYVRFPFPYDILMVVGIHFAVGVAAVLLKITKSWEK